MDRKRTVSAPGARRRLFAFIEQTLDKNADAPEAEVIEDIGLAVREVREEAGT